MYIAHWTARKSLDRLSTRRGSNWGFQWFAHRQIATDNMNPSETGSGSVERQLFVQALEKTAGQPRAAFLDGACGDNWELRRRLDGLLQKFESLGSFLEEPALSLPDESAIELIEGVDSMIGRYRLLEKIGEGGFGDVWMAQQEEPVRRRVAIKLIKLGMDTREVVTRFEAERQALALMDHPCIAKILDGGATDEGRPYFVMELVRGLPITNYCDEHRLGLKDRLVLFIQVCEAVQHAHQKGLIHRDIKSNNILVTEQDGKAVPKVIDFGVARAISQPLTEKTRFTRFGQIIGTPTYMSPEQAGLGGLDVDTRSDIYSLGVVLYELVTGRTPFDTNGILKQGIELIMKTIREAEPLRPSTRLSMLNVEDLGEVAAKRQADPQRLRGLVCGDLDWIVMKALDKDRGRRYETANGLAMDLKRHLNNEAVVARPPSTVYRLQRVWRRNRLALTGASIIVIALVAGIGVSTWEALAARKAQRGEVMQRLEAQKKQAEAESERQRAEQEKRLADRNLYIANMKLTQQAWEQANVLPVLHLLEETAGYAERGFEWYYWQRQSHQELKTFQETGTINAVAFSPDGRRLASASNDSAKVWDLAGLSPPLILIGHTGSVQSVAFSGDGHQILTGSDDRTAKVWDAASGKVALTLRGHNQGICSACFLPGGQRIVTASNDGTAKAWNATDGTELRTFRGHSSYVLSVAVSPDGQRIVTGSADHTAKVWDAATGNMLLNLTGHDSNVNSVAFLPDGRRIVTLDYERTVRIWDTTNGAKLFTLRGHSGGLWSVAAFPDGRRVVSGGEDHTAKVWDALDGTELWTIIGNVAPVRSVAVSADGQWIATGGWDGMIKVWPAEGEAKSFLQNRQNSPIHRIAVSRDGHRLVTAHGDAPARSADDYAAILWDADTGKKLLGFEGHRGVVWSAAFSPDAKRVVTASWDKTAIVWDAGNGEKIAICGGHTDLVWDAAFSPDGDRVVTASADSTAKVWDAKNGKALLTLEGHTAEVKSAAYSKDGRRIATASRDGTARIWEAISGKPLCTLTGHSGWVMAVDFSPDDRRIVTASADGRVRVWDATNGRCLVTLEGHLEAVLTAAFSPDGQRIVTGSDDRTVKLWETASGKELLTLKGHSGWVRSVAFAPDGKRIYSTSGVAAMIWKAASAEEVAAWQNGQPQAPFSGVGLPTGGANK